MAVRSEGTGKMLLHICCGPCATFPVKYLREAGYDLTGYYYNPNIHPYREYKHRRETLREFSRRVKLELLVEEGYQLTEFLREILAVFDNRCQRCYEIRLRQAAVVAKQRGYSSFTTTLLVSPYQKHEVIRQVAEHIAQEVDIPFRYFDFRPGWPEGVKISKEMELYRQPYCGCIFSEKERYYKPKPGKEPGGVRRI